MNAVTASLEYTLQFIKRSLPPSTLRVLEIGGGDGAVAAALMTAGFEVVAIDQDPQSVAKALSRGIDARLLEWPADVEDGFDAVLFTRIMLAILRKASQPPATHCVKAAV